MRKLKLFGIDLLFLGAILMSFSGCVGPIWSTALIMDASSNFKAAKTVEAEKYAPYEYYMAEEFLHKARQKEAYGQFERAIDYAKIAKNMAIAAQKKAHDAKAQESGPSVINPVPQETNTEKINQINTQ
ncbi:MAG: DUF4398 domain-containing protein [Deltaproteobacteria bacterium]|nr:DUF4398 domain-containing protein [Deltaproteobacteria bacterium]